MQARGPVLTLIMECKHGSFGSRGKSYKSGKMRNSALGDTAVLTLLLHDTAIKKSCRNSITEGKFDHGAKAKLVFTWLCHLLNNAKVQKQ